MKIIVLGLRGFPGIQGGVETHCEHLYPLVVARGHSVVVMCRGPYVTWPHDRYEGVELLSLPSPRSKSLEAIVHTILGVFRARLASPDIVHIHAIGPALVVPLARLLGLRVAYTNHGADYARQKWGRAATAVLMLGEASGTRFARGVIAISRPIADHLARAFGRKVTVIPNGVVVQPREIAVDALASLGVSPGHYVLAVGRLVPEKGLHDLIDAFARAAPAGWKLVIVGRADHEGEYSTRLNAQAAQHANVVMAGFMSGAPLRQIYSHAGLFALPSYHEGLPIALLEAMSYGLAVVASDIPANRQAGLPDRCFFAPGDVEAAARRIGEAVATPMPDEERVAQVATIRARFDWDVIADQTIAFYESMMPAAIPRVRSSDSRERVHD